MAEATGWTAIPNWIIRESDLSAYALLTYAAISSRINSDGEAWPSIATIAKEARCSEASARRAMRELIAGGFIESRPRGRDDGGQASNAYRVLIGRPTPLSHRQGAPVTLTPEEEPLEEDPLKKLKINSRIDRPRSSHRGKKATMAQARFLVDAHILAYQDLPDADTLDEYVGMTSAEADEAIKDLWQQVEHGGEQQLRVIAGSPLMAELSPRAHELIERRLDL